MTTASTGADPVADEARATYARYVARRYEIEAGLAT